MAWSWSGNRFLGEMMTKHIWQKDRKGSIEFWEKGERWYWHKKAANGNILSSGSYAHRSSVRRALRKMFGEPS